MGDKTSPMLTATFHEFYSKCVDSVGKNEFILSTNESQSFLNVSSQSTITFINSCLHTTRKRKDGSVLLCSFIGQCSSSLFLDNAETWAKLLLKGVLSFDPIETQYASCHAMCRLLNASAPFPELGRKFSNDLMPQLLNRLTDCNIQWKKLAIMTLVCCIKNYPGPCGLFRKKIENFLIECLNSKNDRKLKEDATRAFVYVAQCGGPGNKFSKYTDAWSMYFAKVLSLLEKSLDELYGFVEFGSINDKGKDDSDETFEFVSIDEEEPIRTINLKERIFLACQILGNMFNVDYPVRFAVEDAVNVICRMTSVSPFFLLTRPTSGRMRLAAVVFHIHIYALNLLQSVIKFAGSNMLNIGSTIHQLFLQGLSWIDQMQTDRKHGYSSPYSKVSVVLWETIFVWLQTLGSSSGIESVADDIIKYALQQIKQGNAAENVEIDSKTKLNEVSDLFHSKKKSNKKDTDKTPQSFTSQRISNKYANWEAVAVVWKVIREILLFSGSFIKRSSYQAIYSVILPLLSNQNSFQIPYCHPKCLGIAYATLSSCIQSPHPNYPYPIQIAKCLFARGMLSKDPDVKDICHQGLLVCESIIHPRAPSLQQENIASLSTEQVESEINSQTDVFVFPRGIEFNSKKQQEESSIDRIACVQKQKEDFNLKESTVSNSAEKISIYYDKKKHESSEGDLMSKSPEGKQESDLTLSLSFREETPDLSTNMDFSKAEPSDDVPKKGIAIDNLESNIECDSENQSKGMKRKYSEENDNEQKPITKNKNIELMMDAFVPVGPDSD